MNGHTGASGGDERAIAYLLRYGTWLASAVLAAGVAAGWLQARIETTTPALSGSGLMKVGVALLIFLPVARVTLMFFLFLRERDIAFMAISALVLAIMAVGFLVGL